MNMETLKESNTFRVLFIGFLVLLLLIPMGMVESVIYERNNLYYQAQNEIAESWGREQLLVGPVLTLSRAKYFSRHTGWSYDNRYKHVRPENMSVDAKVDTQIRYRSIYKVPVYTADIHISGRFALSEVELGDETGRLVELDEGLIQIPVKSTRSLKEPIRLYWNEEEIKLIPRRVKENAQGIVFVAKLPAEALRQDQFHSFEIKMKLAGSGAFSFISSAQSSNINVNSNWPSPGFYGAYLPSNHTITEDGFSASWQVNDVLSDFGYGKSEIFSHHLFHNQQAFGVNLIQPVDTYQVVTRAAKYAILFIGLTFMVYFFTELFGQVRLHPIQYLFVGVANCIFYLLLLSLAEHIHFNLAYVISSLASIALISLYSLSVLKSRGKALIVFAVTSALYTYLFVTLRSEGFALLIGSVGLFVILAVAMYLTRNIDWHNTGKKITTD